MKSINVYSSPHDSDIPITSFVYLHGKLEKKYGTDFCYISNKPNIAGEYECYVNGNERSKLFLWNATARQIGLVVACDDKAGLKEAKELYNSNAEAI